MFRLLGEVDTLRSELATRLADMDASLRLDPAWTEALPLGTMAVALAVTTCAVPDGYELRLGFEYDDDGESVKTMPRLEIWETDDTECSWTIYFMGGKWTPVGKEHDTPQEAIDDYTGRVAPVDRIARR